MNKEKLVSWFNTFAAVFLTAVAANIDSLDVQNLSKGAMLAFIITVIRSMIKIVSTKYI